MDDLRRPSAFCEELMSRRTRRHRLTGVLLGLVLGLQGLALPRITAAAATTPPAEPGTGSQPLPEVTVSGRRLDARTLNHVIQQFVQSHAKPSALIGQIGRWREDVCPVVSGLQGPYDEFVSRRILSVAQGVGAPARAAGRKCDANIEVVFTPEPQGLLDHIASKYRPLLGYYRVSESKQVTTFSHPVQAWYMTGSRSLDYQPPIVGLDKVATTGSMAVDPTAASPFITGLQVDSEQTSGLGSGGLGASGIAGSYLTRGLRSEFVHVLIIVDAKAVARYPLQSVSDYIALLALTRLASLDTCSELPSIVNLFTANCGAPPVAMTAADTAYLQALYGADLDQNLNIEQGDMHDRMLRAISGRR
jgi:hypothetical protein